jgi:hypothetical protein
MPSIALMAIAASGTGEATNAYTSGSSNAWAFPQAASGVGAAHNARIGSSGGTPPVAMAGTLASPRQIATRPVPAGTGSHMTPSGTATRPVPTAVATHPTPEA